MKKLAQHIESLIFVAEKPLKFAEILDVLEELFEAKVKKKDIDAAISEIKTRYEADDSAIELTEIAGGYQFLTKGAFHNTVGIMLKQNSKKKLSTAALETLAIIAYKQPTTKTDAEAIRGVSCDYSIQKLLEKELISMVGRAETPGRPLLYATSEKFMDYFGLSDLTDLPKPKEFRSAENTIGSPEKEDAVKKLPEMTLLDDTIVIVDFGFYKRRTALNKAIKANKEAVLQRLEARFEEKPPEDKSFVDTIIVADFM
jgi:segregation and condensation protein B